MGQGQSAPKGSTAKEADWSRATSMAISAFTAVAWYNVAELNIQVFLTFKRRRGLYFWALIISSYGCVLHALGFLMKFYLTDLQFLSVTIITLGWYPMVTGQSVVLYSRLHLVVREQRILTGILAMIIIDAIIFHIPTTILTYLSNTQHPAPNETVLSAFNVYEKLQMTGFCIQEFIISGVYVWATISLLRPVYHGRTRKVMTQLIWINLIIIVMDIVLLAMEYSNIYEIEATLKAAVYSIKLKLEFAVLNQLMTLANSSVNNHQHLHIEDADGKKEKMPGRSKSTEYISHRYRKPRKRPERPPAPIPPKPTANVAEKPSKPTHQPSTFPLNSPRSRQGTDHIEFLGVDKPLPQMTRGPSRDSVNPITNPAAFYERGRRQSPPDFYAALEEAEKEGDSAVVSPTWTGTTLNIGHQSAATGRRRRAAPPPNLELGREIMPSGLIRSTRPSVSDWAHGPDSGESPSTDELRLEPFDSETSVRSPGSVRHAREMANRSLGELHFMTSALKE